MPGWGFSMRVLVTTILMALAQQSALAEAMIDPTKPPAAVMGFLPNTQSDTEKPWELSAIQENGKGGFAVVNGQMVEVGERYEGFKLTSVKNQKAVFIAKSGEKKVIGMGISRFVEPTPPQSSVKKQKPAQQLKTRKLKSK